jgi:hypothetical protein
MSSKDEYLIWRKLQPVGCAFARYLSSHPGEFGQRFEEISGTDPTTVAGTIATRIDELVADESASAATLLLPDIVAIEDLLAASLALRAHPNWSVTTTMLEPLTSQMVAVRIVREIPFGDTTRPSEALVLGSFDEFPPTRRAPVTALEIFVGEPMQNDPKNPSQPTTKANLSHIDLSDSDLVPGAIDRLWKLSETGRLRSLGGNEDNRAKAKVSFVVSAALARNLRCEP